MSEKNSISPLEALKSYVENNFPLIICSIAIFITVIVTFGFQNHIVGWEPGYNDYQPKHHGWVSAHTLAIISHATPENHFVGYAQAFIDDQNKIDYQYFDRYPVFFSALFNRVLTAAHTLADQILLAKQMMNVIFLATLIAAFLLLDKLANNKPLSLAIVLLAFSNRYLLWYKDMVHFDQPALFGFLLLTYSIALYKLDGVKVPLYVSTFVAIALGRGYASYAVLIVWLGIEAFLILRTNGLDFREKFIKILRHPSVLLFILAIAWGGSLLSYNLIVEAQKRNVSVFHSGILHSARNRLSLNLEYNQEKEGLINWPGFLSSQVNRIIQWSFPLKFAYFGLLENRLVLGGMFLIMGVMIRRQSLEKRIIYIIIVLSGIVWLLPLRNLAAFHDYTTMYYIGIPLVFFLSVFKLLNPSGRLTYALLMIGVAVYVSAIIQLRDWHEEQAGKANAYTYDFVQILEKIDGTGNNIYLAENIPYGPYPAGLFLSEQYFSSEKNADYVVTRNRKYSPNNLTPYNQVIFLFEK
jgi:hypothetical protein